MNTDKPGKMQEAEVREIIEENRQLREEIKKRIIELEHKNHELEIEASLERVRAKAMAMHNSSDLPEAAGTVFTELNKLGINPIRTGFVLLKKDSRKAKLYPATSFDKENMVSFTGEFEFIGHPVFEKQYESWQKKENYFPVLEGELLKSYYKILAKELSVPYQNFPTDKKQFGSFLPFSEGFLFTWSDEPYSQKEIIILDRFKVILNLTITRFLDLQRAETQTREAKIEAALERVRSKAMAMRKSDDLNDAVARVFEELDKLNIGILRCGIGILNKEKRCAEVWTTTIAEQGRIIQVSGDESMDIHPLLAGAFEAWLRQGDFTYVLEGDDMSNYYRAVMKTNFHLPASQILVEHAEELKHYYYGTAFESGMLFAFRETAFSDEAKAVMKRFAGVFNLTYKRFLDIQNAEALALKAQIEEQKLREEKKRSDSLLLNILPEEIANELKQFGKSYARKHEEVTILFADIKGFSSIAENLSADELVTQLDECFRAFDKIVEKHGLEKIKTVGDAYVCACGLPKPVADHAVKTVGAALDMIEFIKGFGMTKKIQNLPAFEFRVGIHTGPVVTGVVGLKKFTYDIWGDAVNMAARMEQHGEAGRINVSGTTYQFIKDKFKCIHRGKIEAKNKGEVDMYFVETAG
jgi:class 3 adenylate cyclase